MSVLSSYRVADLVSNKGLNIAGVPSTIDLFLFPMLSSVRESRRGFTDVQERVIIFKNADSEYTAFEFCTKKISIADIGCDILDEIHKFPFPVQQMLGAEACAVEGRIEKDKPAP
ncbi:hypothetical protein C2G38_2174140 [Gigaspora rosea]|uniref:Uncharacterized protein n=1 Tax=Gigaspora rosea TaxID=44941 RepID=A0A397VM23_9GLOM|nr:hypothetical protein C2G38_2174140 [Gigaspora rosea]